MRSIRGFDPRRIGKAVVATVAAFAGSLLAAEPPPPPAGQRVELVQPDGTSFIVGRSTFPSSSPRWREGQALAIWKRRADGTPDPAFGGAGYVRVPVFGVFEEARGVAVQPDGRIVVAGHAWDPICGYDCEDRTAVVRLDPDGSPDATFGGDGRIVLVVSQVAAASGSGGETSFDRTDVRVLGDGTIDIGYSIPAGNSTYAQLRPDGARVTKVYANSFGEFVTRESLRVQAQGLWYASPAEAESGWGVSFAQQGEVIFATWFTYDLSGSPWWLTATLVRTGEGVYNGALYETRGPALDAQPFDPGKVARAVVGDATLTFADRDRATLAYNLKPAGRSTAVSQSKAIARQVFGPLPACSWGTQDRERATNVQDLWWASPADAESGWGLQLAHQGDTIFAAWFTYGFDGRPLWLTGTATKVAEGRYEGTLDRTTGPAFDAVPWDPGQVYRTQAGTYTLAFTDGNHGTFAYRLQLDGHAVEQSKPITRQAFSALGTTCR